MFQTGQKVACIDDKFEPWVFDLYRQLPKKDKIYTVRALRSGRSNPQFTINDDAEIKLTGAEFDILVLLDELHNPDDPHSSVKQELGFRSERFAPLLEDFEEEKAYVQISVGGGKKQKAAELAPLGK